jgi:hypothetical protein
MRGGGSGWLLGLKGRDGGPYNQILASQAADMRASLWTYSASGPVRGPTHPHPHTALPTSRYFSHSVVHCESVLEQPLCADFAQWPYTLAPPAVPCRPLCTVHPFPFSQQFLFDFPTHRQPRGIIGVFRIGPVTDAGATCSERPATPLRPRDLNVLNLSRSTFSHTRSSSRS